MHSDEGSSLIKASISQVRFIRVFLWLCASRGLEQLCGQDPANGIEEETPGRI